MARGLMCGPLWTLLWLSMSLRGRLAPYKAALEAISSRTRTPLSSLVVSFAVLHEITAIVPLVSVFFLARSFGVGEYAVNFVQQEISEGQQQQEGWLREKSQKWMDEGEQWAARVGRRYGVFGFPKKSESNSVGQDDIDDVANTAAGGRLAGDVANAVFAYGLTKVWGTLYGFVSHEL